MMPTQSIYWASVKKIGVKDDFINRDKTEYSSHTLAEVVNGINRNE